MELRGSYTDFLNERNAQNNTIKESRLRDNPKMIMKDIEPHLKSEEDCKLEKATVLWNLEPLPNRLLLNKRMQ